MRAKLINDSQSFRPIKLELTIETQREFDCIMSYDECEGSAFQEDSTVNVSMDILFEIKKKLKKLKKNYWHLANNNIY